MKRSSDSEPTSNAIASALASACDASSFIQNVLIDALNWPIDAGSVEEISCEWSSDGLRIADLNAQSTCGVLRQIVLPQCPWKVYLLQFANPDVFTTGGGSTGTLRRVLRSLELKLRERMASLEGRDALFICTHDYAQYRFARFSQPRAHAAMPQLALFGCDTKATARTICEHNLPLLAFVSEWSPREWRDRWAAAFDAEKLRRTFYDDYRVTFATVEGIIKVANPHIFAPPPNASPATLKEYSERLRLYTQTLFNRLMFIRFIERKEWLIFNEKQDERNYLAAMWSAGGDRQQSLYKTRIEPLFFEGLAAEGKQHTAAYGSVRLLSGSLFQRSEFDNQIIDLPNTVFEPIFGPRGLFYRFNFTIEESTPLDIEVAVDPEMLGKVFEELVTGRHESGSYYTPRQIVSFMCREALAGYLGEGCSKLIHNDSIDGIDAHRAGMLLQRLETVTVCDPACGSGAYLLGMLHELDRLAQQLSTLVPGTSAKDRYQRKLRTISRNLYGVDQDSFAAEIARLRLVLTLVVDHEPHHGEVLPHVDLTIKVGDSLRGPNPQQIGLPERDHDPDIFGWQVQFAEVFADGGFDIVLANPPYGIKCRDPLRYDYFPPCKNTPKQSKDSYGLFMARGLQLLKPGGHFSYIVSNTWRTIKSHRRLREKLLCETTVSHILDLPAWVFGATVNTCILSLTKTPAPEHHTLIAGDFTGLEPNAWDQLELNLAQVASRSCDIQTPRSARYTYRQSIIRTYDNLSFFIASPRLYCLMSDPRCVRLDAIADVKVGLQTGDNQYYIRKEATARGSYDIIDRSKVLTEDEIAGLSDDEKQNGVHPANYAGRHFVPHDKGGASDAQSGWLPNYYVPTDYYLDWSGESVARLRQATVADVKRRKGSKHDVRLADELRLASRFQNAAYYFQQGITYSQTGYYAPTFRMGCGSGFNVESTSIFPHAEEEQYLLLAILCSRLYRYQIKQFIDHTVHASQDKVASTVVPRSCNGAIVEKIRTLVQAIGEKQRAERNYAYHLHEQKELDALIYELYGLSAEDIREVELWFCRRYERLAKAQGLWDEVHQKYASQMVTSPPPNRPATTVALCAYRG
ncbi:MAG: HsdM family class I SAM-dependent methyltransferase [Phycisphaerales bacterium]